MARKIPPALWLLLPLAYFLFFFDMAKVGLIGPDEPRYASISRSMAASGDWVTPRLNGQPWFEKPALLYWMQGAAFRAGLGPEVAPRLPVALAACAFLALYWWILNREFGCAPAIFATAILGTSAAWIVCAQVGVPDLPLTAAYSAAMLLALPWATRRDPKLLPAAAGCLALAVLAKGLVPLVLVTPLLYPWGRPLRTAWRDNLVWLRPRVVLPFLLVVLPWYVLCTLRNGTPFLKDFFWKHHVERFVSAAALQHGQPFWFYLPIVLAALLPWTPLAGLALRRAFLRDPRRLFLLCWLLLVLVFFSASVNKLPAYILPLLPAAAALLGLALAEAGDAAPYLAGCTVLLVAFVIAAPMLPSAVPAGITHATLPPFRWFWLLPLALAAGVWMLERHRRRTIAVIAIAAGAAAGTVYLKQVAAPDLDRTASARELWRQIAPRAAAICIDWLPRSTQYSLDYYSAVPLPDCAHHPKTIELLQMQGQPPRLMPPSHGAVQEGGK
jgi:4-amino-4-deoxy-L-arabinose transferase-like glycosyltransferase